MGEEHDPPPVGGPAADEIVLGTRAGVEGQSTGLPAARWNHIDVLRAAAPIGVGNQAAVGREPQRRHLALALHDSVRPSPLTRCDPQVAPRYESELGTAAGGVTHQRCDSGLGGCTH